MMSKPSMVAGSKPPTFAFSGNSIISSPKPAKALPTPAVALFPKEYLEWAPKSYVERIYNIQQWTEMPEGGHFAALEKPDLLIKDIREFGKKL